MSDTPRTDAVVGMEHKLDNGNTISYALVPAVFAQQLERKLNAMTAAKNKALEALRVLLSNLCDADRDGDQQTIDELDKLISELEEVKI